MVKGESITIRTSEELKICVLRVCNEYGFKLTDFIENSVINYLENFKELKNSRMFKEMKRKQHLKDIKRNITEEMSNRYFIKNFYRRVFTLTSSYIFNKGDVNMIVINDVIDETLNMFSFFEESFKLKFSEDIQIIEKLRKKEYFLDKYMRYMNNLQQHTQLNNKDLILISNVEKKIEISESVKK